MSVEIALELDLKWREAELASLKRLAITSSTETVAYQALLRSLWALLYAHFEGFTKFCWDTVLDHIQMEGVPVSELENKFAMLALEGDFKKLRGDLTSSTIWKFFEGVLPNSLAEHAAFSDEGRLRTDSNLWPNVFERESLKLGIECDELNKYRARIKALVARRNDIAHGKSMVIVGLSEYHDYESAALCLMHELAIKSIEIVDRKSYMATPRL